MTVDLIYDYIILALPSVIAVFTMLGMVIKVLKSFTDLRNAVKDKSELDEIKSQFKIILNENIELKRQIETLVNKMDRVKKPELKDENNKEGE